jgi:hypothetical protein
MALLICRIFPLPSSTLTIVEVRSSVQDTPTCRLPTTTKSNSTWPIRLNRMKVSTHEHSEQSSDMYIGKGGQVCDEPQSPVVDGDVDVARRDEEHDGNGTCMSN